MSTENENAPAVEQQGRVRLWEIEDQDLTNEQLFQILEERYAPSVVPKCRVCGADLSIGACGGGEPTRYYCSVMSDAPLGKYGSIDWNHYSESMWVDRRQGGDCRVMELVRRFKQSNQGLGGKLSA